MTNTVPQKAILKKAQTSEAGTITNEPNGRFVKRIGYTTYRVGIHFSDTSTETAKDKITRLVRMETESGKAAINQ